MKTLLLISSFFLLSWVKSFAQKDTTISLHEVQISSSRLSYNSGLRLINVDSSLMHINRNSSLSDLLNESSAIYLKSYGSGGLSTISLRGGSAYHTAVLWNGFSLASPMHGQTDLSLERNFFFDDINVQFGGTSSLWGSGAVSGNILLLNKPEFDAGIKISAGINLGSYSEFSQHASVTYSQKKYSISLKFYNDNDKNNFLYNDNYSQTQKNQIHASIKQYGIMNDNYFQTGKNSLLNFRIWYSYSNREIPPTIQQVNSDATQLDINTRISSEWKYSGKKSEFIVRSAYFHEKLNYDDDFLTQPSNNNCRSFINESTYEIRLGKHHLIQAGINYKYSFVDSSSNLINANESRLSLFSLYRFRSTNEKFETSASARKEFSDQNTAPITFSGGINFYPLKKILLRFAASSVYRNPTLNDLYWTPGGNSELKPEDGYSVEGGFQATLSDLPGNTFIHFSTLTLNTTIFHKKINNWIVWYPSTGLVWKPQNLLEVISQGLELNIKYQFTRNSFSTGIDYDFFYTTSTNEKPILQNDASVHQQLIYVPEYRWNTRLFVSYNKCTLSFNHSYTGYRYTSSDNIYYLEPYSIDNLQLDKLFVFDSFDISLFFKVSNIFNTDYQSVLNRPMPLRTYSGGITLTYKKPNHSNIN